MLPANWVTLATCSTNPISLGVVAIIGLIFVELYCLLIPWLCDFVNIHFMLRVWDEGTSKETEVLKWNIYIGRYGWLASHATCSDTRQYMKPSTGLLASHAFLKVETNCITHRSTPSQGCVRCNSKEQCSGSTPYRLRFSLYLCPTLTIRRLTTYIYVVPHS